MSLRTTPEIFASPYALPSRLHWEKFAEAWTKSNYGTYFWNSTIVVVTAVALLTVIGAMAAHCLARYRFRGSRLVRFVILSGMILPPQLLILSLFQILLEYGLYNTLTGLDHRLCRRPSRDDRLHPRGLFRADPAGSVRRRADGWLLRSRDLLAHHPADRRARALHDRDAQLHHSLERVPLRGGAAHRRRQAHSAARHHAFHGQPPARCRHARDRPDDRHRADHPALRLLLRDHDQGHDRRRGALDWAQVVDPSSSASTTPAAASSP